MKLHEFLQKRSSGEKATLQTLQKRYPLAFSATTDDLIEIALSLLTVRRMEKELTNRLQKSEEMPVQKEKVIFSDKERFLLYQEVCAMAHQL